MTTEDIGTNTPQREGRTTESLGDGLERAIADAEKRLAKLLEELHFAARGSAAFRGAEHDAKRLLEWLEAKVRELSGELDKLAKDAGEAAGKVKSAAKKAGGSAESKSETLKGLRVDAENLKERLEAVGKPADAAREETASTGDRSDED